MRVTKKSLGLTGQTKMRYLVRCSDMSAGMLFESIEEAREIARAMSMGRSCAGVFDLEAGHVVNTWQDGKDVTGVQLTLEVA